MNPTECISSGCRHFYTKRLKDRPEVFYCTARRGQPKNGGPWDPPGRNVRIERLRSCPLGSTPEAEEADAHETP